MSTTVPSAGTARKGTHAGKSGNDSRHCLTPIRRTPATTSGAVSALAAPRRPYPCLSPRRTPRAILAALRRRPWRVLAQAPAAPDRPRSSVALHYLLALHEAVRVGDLPLKTSSR